MVLIDGLLGCMVCNQSNSVPLRGLWFLSKDTPVFLIYPVINNSVPLRGLWFLSFSFYDVMRHVLSRNSVPLRGLWFLSTPMEIAQMIFYGENSVPLRGLWFLSFLTGELDTGNFSKFRPLAGIMVLIETFCQDCVDQMLEIPSPCGDYGSYHLDT